ncbi:MAG: DUF3888 domain-containing protein [Bacillota bacterium]
MKKILIIFCLFAVLISIGVFKFYNFTRIGRDVNRPVPSGYKTPEGSTETLYQDIFITLLHPCIQKAINEYYKDALPYDLRQIEVLSVERLDGNPAPGFIVKLQVVPYAGPHIQFGKDYMTIRIKSNGESEVEKFQHVENSRYMD